MHPVTRVKQNLVSALVKTKVLPVKTSKNSKLLVDALQSYVTNPLSIPVNPISCNVRVDVGTDKRSKHVSPSHSTKLHNESPVKE